MPYIQSLDFKPKWPYGYTHFNTITTAQWRNVSPLQFARHRLELQDGDFMDLDLSTQNNSTVAIILHGLEGDAKRPYMLGMGKAMQSIEMDTLHVNLRGCSGEPNRLLKSYHSGSTDDLQAVIDYVISAFHYQRIVLIGFSLGGNIVLKYTGEQATDIHPDIKAAIGISAPVDLTSCANAMGQRKNFLYMRRFLNNLRVKIDIKKDMLPSDMDYEQLMSAKNFHEFDHWFTARVNGFDSAAHYWETCSSKPVLSQVAIPTLLLNAQDDTFLGADCYPADIAQDHTLFHFMAPQYGGHVGFSGDNRQGMLWSEHTVAQFIQKQI